MALDNHRRSGAVGLQSQAAYQPFDPDRRHRDQSLRAAFGVAVVAFGVAGDVSLVQPVPAANSARIAAATMRARRPSRKRSSIGSHLRRVFGIKLEGWVDSDDAHEIPWGPRGLTGCLLDP